MGRFLILLFIVFGLRIPQAQAASVTFARTLSLGAYGEDVLALQQILNADRDTQIASAGPGSPGQETPHFGALTQAAVRRFQQKHASEVLYPNGLTTPTGIVGPFTQAVLQKQRPSVKTEVTAPVNTSSSLASSSASLSQRKVSDLSNSRNPNLRNIPKIFAVLDVYASRKGLSSVEIGKAKDLIYKISESTSVDLTAKFLKDELNRSVTPGSTEWPLLQALRSLKNLFVPTTAYATTEEPFGALLLFPYTCDNGDYILIVSPIPSSGPVLLTYTDGTQQYAQNNIPTIAQYLLGFYDTTTADCTFYLGSTEVTLTTEGTVTETVGSS
jgi:peptidoglycan hydrolase-like protein with peptidoglycan-binding domain